jgi:hypothetical protein
VVWGGAELTSSGIMVDPRALLRSLLFRQVGAQYSTSPRR